VDGELFPRAVGPVRGPMSMVLGVGLSVADESVHSAQ